MKRRTAERAEAAAVAEERVDEAAQRVSPFRSWFGHVATKVSDATGSVWTFALAILLIVVWVATGPMFGFSDTWQLMANTFTTLVTFLMVFLIQNTQNRDAKATELKLDELIRAIADARNQFIGAELEPEELLDREKKEIEAEKDTPSAAHRPARGPSHDSRPHNGEPLGHR
jgi:low affinity Fe/Cu permease